MTISDRLLHSRPLLIALCALALASCAYSIQKEYRFVQIPIGVDGDLVANVNGQIFLFDPKSYSIVVGKYVETASNTYNNKRSAEISFSPTLGIPSDEFIFFVGSSAEDFSGDDSIGGQMFRYVIAAYNISSGTLRELTLSRPISTAGGVFRKENRHLYMVDKFSGELVTIDAAAFYSSESSVESNPILKVVEVETSLEGVNTLAYDEADGHLFVGASAPGQIAMVDLRANEELRVFDNPLGVSINSLAILKKPEAPDQKALFALNNAAGRLFYYVLDSCGARASCFSGRINLPWLEVDGYSDLHSMDSRLMSDNINGRLNILQAGSSRMKVLTANWSNEVDIVNAQRISTVRIPIAPDVAINDAETGCLVAHSKRARAPVVTCYDRPLSAAAINF